MTGQAVEIACVAQGSTGEAPAQAAHAHGMRLAVGCTPRHLLLHVLREGIMIASIGIAVGALGGFVLSRVATSFFTVQLPGALAVAAAAAVLLAAAVVASWMPAARAARIDVIEALRSD